MRGAGLGWPVPPLHAVRAVGAAMTGPDELADRIRLLQRRLRDVFPSLAVSTAEVERQAGIVKLDIAFEPDAHLLWSTDLDELEAAIDTLEHLTHHHSERRTS